MEKTLSTLRVNAERLYASLDALGAIGAYEVDTPPGDAKLSGVRRVTLTDEDKTGRDLVCSWFRDAGLTVRIDRIGNVYGRRAGRSKALPPVLVGSHIDSVPTAGRFDGCLGVLAGLEVLRTLNEQNVTTDRPIEVAFFTEEEGCRFGTDMLGSAVATGRIGLAEALALRDADGKSVGDELQRIGYDGDAAVGDLKPHAYVECHIEQGPQLIRSGIDIGVVTGVQAISWQELRLQGRSAHAGTTPIAYRADCGLVAAKINVLMRDLCDSGDYGEMRATMGALKAHPGVINVIPGRMQVSIDLRNPDDAAMARSEADVRSGAEAIAAQHSVTLSWRQTARTHRVAFDAGIQQIISDTAAAFGLAQERLISGAGHDAQEWAAVCPTAMIFVPGEHDGISHNPRELSTLAQCANGANVLLHTVLQLSAG
jgi:N-carbamoyl-L-amino-acid hydrolase